MTSFALWRAIVRPRSDVGDLVKSLAPFSDLDRGERLQFAKSLHRRAYFCNEPIFTEREPGTGMYIIVDGRVVISQVITGVDTQIATLGPGDFFGELSLVTDCPRTASAVASTDCQLLGFFRPDLFEIMERNPRLAAKISLGIAATLGKRLLAADRLG